MSRGKKKKRSAGSAFKAYLRNTGNAEGLRRIEEMESAGSPLVAKGKGYIGEYEIRAIHGYDAFRSAENRERYARILETSSDISSASVALAYCVAPGAAHVLVKSSDESGATGYLRSINALFEREYDDGKQTVGPPFVKKMRHSRVVGRNAILDAIGRIHAYSPEPAETYPHNGYRALMRGDSIANLALGIELDIFDSETFADELAEHSSARRPARRSEKERLGRVLEELREKYVYPYGQVKEERLVVMIGEACARSGARYRKVAKKLHLYRGRRDLLISVVADCAIRRGASFAETVDRLGLRDENVRNLAIETLIELNRLTQRSYAHIVNEMMRLDDAEHVLLVSAFRRLHIAHNWDFAQLCEKFHVVSDILRIRAQCRF